MLKQILSSDGTGRNFLFPVIIVLLIASTIFSILQAASGYNWDMDHLIYSGSRLLDGELVWVSEYEDKLPLVSFIFASVAYFGTITAWFPIALFFVFCGMASVYYLIDRISCNLTRASGNKTNWSALCGSFFLLAGLIFAPEGLHHISGVASCASLTAIALTLSISFSGNKISSKTVLVYLSAILFASFAISLRPYLGLVILAGSFWAISYAGPIQKKYFLHWVIWSFCVGTVTIASNFLPYFIFDNSEAVFAGLSMLSQKLNPQSVFSIVEKLYGDLFMHTPLIILMCTMNLSFILYIFASKLTHFFPKLELNLKHETRFIQDSIFFCFILPILILIMILRKHFFHHYVQMFIPFLSIGVGLFFYLSFALINEKVRYQNNKLLGFLFSIVVLSLLPGSWKYLRPLDVNKEINVSIVQAEVNKAPFKVDGFLMPENIYVHWRLKEPRLGFPHAANTGHILKGWWTKANIPNNFNLPTTLQTYCSKLMDLESVFIILNKDSKLNSCFDGEEKLVLHKTIQIEGGNDLNFFINSGASYKN